MKRDNQNNINCQFSPAGLSKVNFLLSGVISVDPSLLTELGSDVGDADGPVVVDGLTFELGLN
jgi:hypothetical protein